MWKQRPNRLSIRWSLARNSSGDYLNYKAAQDVSNDNVLRIIKRLSQERIGLASRVCTSYNISVLFCSVLIQAGTFCCCHPLPRSTVMQRRRSARRFTVTKTTTTTVMHDDWVYRVNTSVANRSESTTNCRRHDVRHLVNTGIYQSRAPQILLIGMSHPKQCDFLQFCRFFRDKAESWQILISILIYEIYNLWQWPYEIAI